MEYFYCTILKRSEYDFWTSTPKKISAQIDIYNKINLDQQEARKKAEEELKLKQEGRRKTTFKVLD